ncbi:MAG: DMT family transporter [Ardenticatenaceae bacterium]
MWKSMLSPKHLSPNVATMMIVLSTIGFGLSPLFAKALLNAGLASPAVVFHRYVLATILFLPALTFAPEKRTATFWAMSGGVAAGLGRIAYLEALKNTPVATMGLIYYTYPLFALLIAALWLRNFPPRRAIFAGVLTVVAASMAFSPTSVGIGGVQPLILSFLTPLTFGYAVIILSDKVTQLTPFERLAGFSFGAVLGLLPLILSLDSSVVIPSRLADWYTILGLAIMVYLIPNLLYIIAAPFAGSARAAIAGSIGLPTMFIGAWLTFGEPIVPLQFVAGLLVVVAIWMTRAKKSENLDLSEEAKKMKIKPPTPVKVTTA